MGGGMGAKTCNHGGNGGKKVVKTFGERVGKKQRKQREWVPKRVKTWVHKLNKTWNKKENLWEKLKFWKGESWENLK